MKKKEWKFEDVLKDTLDTIVIKEVCAEDILSIKAPTVITFNQRPKLVSNKED